MNEKETIANRISEQYRDNMLRDMLELREENLRNIKQQAQLYQQKIRNGYLPPSRIIIR